MPRRRKKLPTEPVSTTIESLSHEGRGVSRVDGKTVFIDGALPGEDVSFLYTRRRGNHDEGYAVAVRQPSPLRVAPPCTFYDRCGGCSLMHLAPAEQLLHKQRVLLEMLDHIGRVSPAEVLPPLTGALQGYRHKARLGVKHVIKKDRVLVGFREKRSSFIADIERCEVLHPAVGERIQALQQLIAGLSIHNRVAQIEVAVADNLAALILRHLDPFNDTDLVLLRKFEQEQGLVLYLQPGGLDSIRPLTEPAAELFYTVDDENIQVRFQPQDFTQVNFSLNRDMISLATELLQAGPDDNVLDLFCGLGNFTLPLARRVARVTGLEGSAPLIERARQNAVANGIDNVRFEVCDLAAEPLQPGFELPAVNKLLLDPPRSGAQEVLRQLPLTQVTDLVYVSCNPATLARDAGILVNERGFTLQKTGVMDMFPHTSHVESIARFSR